MIDLILIILLIISIFKPDILLSRKAKERATEEQKKQLIKNIRLVYGLTVAMIESLAIIRYSALIGGVLSLIFIVLFFALALPGAIKNSKIMKELENVNAQATTVQQQQQPTQQPVQEQPVQEQYTTSEQDSPIRPQ